MHRLARAVVLASACLWLAGCQTDIFASGDKPAVAAVDPQAPGSEAMASATPADGAAATSDGLYGDDQNDSLSLGKKAYRAGDYGLAEMHFRRATESRPRDAEAWVGLAASYDRLRRFELADRAYDQATRIAGPTVEILNNQGYSYILRGDYKRARQTLMAAQAKAPGNAYVRNNLTLLETSARKRKGVAE